MPRQPRPPSRADGADTRERLVRTALRLFAEQGFANTSTREISETAGVNLASIGYYFGDKAGLYRAAFFEPLGEAPSPEQIELPADQPLRLVLLAFYRQFLEPLKQGDVIAQCMRLHFREMVDPTGVWNEVVDREIKPQHAALTRLLGRHLHADPDSIDVHRLTFAVISLGVYMFVGRELMVGIRPEVIKDEAAIDIMAERLALYGEAMVEAETKRMAAARGKRAPAAKPAGKGRR